MVDVGLPHARRRANTPPDRADPVSVPSAPAPPPAAKSRRAAASGHASAPGFVDKWARAQERLQERAARVGRGRYGRVLRMARKPTPEQFRKTSLVAGLGIVVIGAVGFLIYLIFTFIPQR